jgi:hypothetical protein
MKAGHTHDNLAFGRILQSWVQSCRHC